MFSNENGVVFSVVVRWKIELVLLYAIKQNPRGDLTIGSIVGAALSGNTGNPSLAWRCKLIIWICHLSRRRADKVAEKCNTSRLFSNFFSFSLHLLLAGGTCPCHTQKRGKKNPEDRR